MSNKSKTPFMDKFFRVTRKVTHFTVGNDFQDVFESFDEIELSYDEYRRLRDAIGIEIKADGFIGTLREPVVICGHCYPTGVLAVFQSKEPGSRFAIFSLADGDETT